MGESVACSNWRRCGASALWLHRILVGAFFGVKKSWDFFGGHRPPPMRAFSPHEIRLLTTMTCLIIPQERLCFLGGWHWAGLGHLDSHEQNPKTVKTHPFVIDASLHYLGGSLGFSIHLY